VVGLAGHRAGLRRHIGSVARHHVLTLSSKAETPGAIQACGTLFAHRLRESLCDASRGSGGVFDFCPTCGRTRGGPRLRRSALHRPRDRVGLRRAGVRTVVVQLKLRSWSGISSVPCRRGSGVGFASTTSPPCADTVERDTASGQFGVPFGVVHANRVVPAG
jgi:hypothetical protein